MLDGGSRVPGGLSLGVGSTAGGRRVGVSRGRCVPFSAPPPAAAPVPTTAARGRRHPHPTASAAAFRGPSPPGSGWEATLSAAAGMRGRRIGQCAESVGAMARPRLHHAACRLQAASETSKRQLSSPMSSAAGSNTLLAPIAGRLTRCADELEGRSDGSLNCLGQLDLAPGARGHAVGRAHDRLGLPSSFLPMLPPPIEAVPQGMSSPLTSGGQPAACGLQAPARAALTWALAAGARDRARAGGRQHDRQSHPAGLNTETGA